MCQQEYLIKECKCETLGHLRECFNKKNCSVLRLNVPDRTKCDKHPPRDGCQDMFRALPSVYFPQLPGADGDNAPATQQTTTTPIGQESWPYVSIQPKPQTAYSSDRPEGTHGPMSRDDSIPPKGTDGPMSEDIQYHNPEDSTRHTSRYGSNPVQAQGLSYSRPLAGGESQRSVLGGRGAWQYYNPGQSDYYYARYDSHPGQTQ